MRVEIDEPAMGELEAIYDYTHHRWGKSQADAYTDEIMAMFDRIAARDIPWRPLHGDFGVEGFAYRCRRHWIYWRADAKVVRIVAILHGRMNLSERVRSAFGGEA